MSDTFFRAGFFDWQFSGGDDLRSLYRKSQFNPEQYMGGFPEEMRANWPSWALGPFVKFEGNPVFEPAAAGWDRGRFGGGVHNGAIVRHQDQFMYVYRGEEPLPESFWDGEAARPTDFRAIDYICDIGVASSDDGVHFQRRSVDGIFRRGLNSPYSFEDVCLVRDGSRYVLFCNRWDWKDKENPNHNGVFIATSMDLVHWEEVGLAFADANVMHRNAAVLQDPENNAVRVDGQFIMYLNDGLIARSHDLLSWESERVGKMWPGGEGCFALTNHNPDRPDDILLFTGGHHSGHFYAIGEVLLSKRDPSTAVDWLDRPILTSDSTLPWEDARSAVSPFELVSCFRDTVFFTGMTKFNGSWWMYYGGSEYYTCLARTRATSASD